MGKWISIFVFLLGMCSCYGKTYKIAWLSPGADSGWKINSNTSVAALKLALDSIEANPMIMNGHSVNIKYFNTDCSPRKTMQAAMEAKNMYNPDMIIGPPCYQGMRVVAQLCTFWNLPVFTWYNPGIEFDGSGRYPTLIRMIPSLTIMGRSLVHLLRQNNWDQFVLIHNDADPWSLYDEAIRTQTAHNEVQMWGSHKVTSRMTSAEIRKLFEKIKRHTRIIVLACPSEDIRQYMIIAESVGMANGNFVFIQLDSKVQSERTLSSVVFSKRRWMKGDADDEKARLAFQSLVHILLDPMDDDEKPTFALPRNRYQDFKRLAVKKLSISNPGWELPAGGQPDVYSLYLYDTVLIWSVLVDKLRAAGKIERDGKLMTREARTLVADGASGYISFNNNNDRVGKVFILSMDTAGAFEPTEILKFNSSNGYESIRIKTMNDRIVRLNGVRANNVLPLTDVLPPGATTLSTAPLKMQNTDIATLSSKEVASVHNYPSVPIHNKPLVSENNPFEQVQNLRSVPDYNKQEISINNHPSAPVNSHSSVPVNDSLGVPVHNHQSETVIHLPSLSMHRHPLLQVNDKPSVPVHTNPPTPVKDKPTIPAHNPPHAPVNDKPSVAVHNHSPITDRNVPGNFHAQVNGRPEASVHNRPEEPVHSLPALPVNNHQELPVHTRQTNQVLNQPAILVNDHREAPVHTRQANFVHSHQEKPFNNQQVDIFSDHQRAPVHTHQTDQVLNQPATLVNNHQEELVHTNQASSVHTHQMKPAYKQHTATVDPHQESHIHTQQLNLDHIHQRKPAYEQQTAPVDMHQEAPIQTHQVNPDHSHQSKLVYNQQAASVSTHQGKAIQSNQLNPDHTHQAKPVFNQQAALVNEHQRPQVHIEQTKQVHNHAAVPHYNEHPTLNHQHSVGHPSQMQLTKTKIPRPPQLQTVMPTTTQPLFPTTATIKTTPANDVIKKLMARLHSLEQQIKEHERHSHQHIPHHTHTPHPLLLKISTTPTPAYIPRQKNNKANNSHLTHNLDTAPGNPPHKASFESPNTLPTTQQSHFVPERPNNLNTHEHPQQNPVQMQNKHPDQNNHLIDTQIHYTPHSHIYKQTTMKITAPPTTITPTTVPPPQSPITTAALVPYLENGQMSDQMIDRISSRLVDHIIGVPANSQRNTNTNNTQNQRENQISREWLANNLDELGPGLIFLRLAQEERRQEAEARRLYQRRLHRQMFPQQYQQQNQQSMRDPGIQRKSEGVIMNSNNRRNPESIPFIDPLASIFDPMVGIFDQMAPPHAEYPVWSWR